ncbi:MAG: AbrB/MazE/SpoVT family DNA-binding domain-containing protein [Syntrophales bacterium]|nr:AbrB/MazE/SpoVT family DNA-binding domain-containing protein [Syntrophales bacterium]
MKISSKRQISIPKKVMETMGLQPGDEVEFEIEKNTARLIPIKTVKVPRDQAWFWTPEWQTKEREADQDISAGRYREFDKMKDLLKDLHGED